jgi:hypothetical protein
MRLIRLPVCKSIIGKRVNICLVFLINIALLAGVTSSSALDKSTELNPLHCTKATVSIRVSITNTIQVRDRLEFFKLGMTLVIF